MKKTTQLVKLVALLVVVLSAKMGYSQCTANFVWTAGANGAVTFTSTSTPTTAMTSYYWNFGNGTSSIVAAPNNTAATQYPANGIYTVVLFYGTGTCSNSISYTIPITNVSTPTCNLNASFTPYTGSNGNYTFGNTSTGTVSGTTYNWSFGDGSLNSSAASPLHTYTANGTYTVVLTANNNFTPTCSDTMTQIINVVNVCSLTANFTFTPTGPGAFSFGSTSTGTTSGATFTWSYGGGGSGTFSGPNPSWTYTANGNYTVLMGVYNGSGCYATHTAVVSVTNVPTPTCNINANFTYSSTGSGGLQFINTSTGTVSGTTWSWNFGDGSPTSSANSPAHAYAANGSYVVTLTANNNFTASCVSTKTMTVYIYSICNLSANFSYTVGNNGFVHFASTSTGTTPGTFYSWTFGDGGTSGGIGGPGSANHTYTSTGTYTVTMIANAYSVSPGCADTISQVITINCIADASFTMVPSGTPQYWYAIPNSTAGVANAVWNWGDGSSSTGLFSSHTYSAAGGYTVCLSVTLTCGSTATWCGWWAISKSPDGEGGVIHIDVMTPEMIAAGISSNSGKDVAYTISPNPSNGSFHVNMNGLSSAKAQISIYNVTGAVIYSTDSDTSNGALSKEIQLNTVPGGVYFIKVDAGNNTYTKKFIINR